MVLCPWAIIPALNNKVAASKIDFIKMGGFRHTCAISWQKRTFPNLFLKPSQSRLTLNELPHPPHSTIPAQKPSQTRIRPLFFQLPAHRKIVFQSYRVPGPIAAGLLLLD